MGSTLKETLDGEDGLSIEASQFLSEFDTKMPWNYLAWILQTKKQQLDSCIDHIP